MTSVFTLWQKFCRQQYSIRKFQRLGTHMHLPNVGRIAKGVNARAIKCCVQKYPTILPLPYTDSTLDWQKEELSPLQHLSIPPKIVVPSPSLPTSLSLNSLTNIFLVGNALTWEVCGTMFQLTAGLAENMNQQPQPQYDFHYQKVELIKTESLGIGSYGAVCKAACDDPMPRLSVLISSTVW